MGAKKKKKERKKERKGRKGSRFSHISPSFPHYSPSTPCPFLVIRLTTTVRSVYFEACTRECPLFLFSLPSKSNTILRRKKFSPFSLSIYLSISRIYSFDRANAIIEFSQQRIQLFSFLFIATIIFRNNILNSLVFQR